jgi:hypothetical protein
MVAALATAGAGVSCRLSEGNGDSEAVCIVPGWTTTVFTAFGLIGSVEPGMGASIADGEADATRTGASPCGLHPYPCRPFALVPFPIPR